MIKIAIIEEQEERQLELEKFLNAQRDFVCSITCYSVEEFLQKISVIGNLQVVIISVSRDAFYNLKPFHLRKIKEINPAAEILILADNIDTKKVITWLRAGVVGYLPKQVPLEEIKEAIEGIRKGEARIVPVMVRQMLEFFRSQKDFEGVLTEREKEIVQCLVEGMSYKLIACRLHVTLDTVRYHLRNIYRKLQVNSISQVISKAVTRDLKV